MSSNRTKPVIITDQLVHGLFVEIDSVRETKPGEVRVTCHPTADSCVRRVTATLDKDRAKDLGLVA
jgi:hypothetical protein